MTSGIQHISIACGQPGLPPFYVMHHLGLRWASRGLRFSAGEGYSDDAQACVLHVDKTRLLHSDIPAPPAGCQVVNGLVHDISKHLHSSLKVKPGDDWDGQVIVKTDLNHFGRPERRANPGLQASRWSQWRARLALRHWQLARQLPDGHYPVLPSSKAVPGWVWRNPAYIVERFMPEREGKLYCLRGWMFLGSRSYGWRLLGADHMVKAATVVSYDFTDEVPDELIELKRRTGFDFGKFDYVMHDGKAIVLDLNKTPSYAGDPASPRLTHLSHGIEEFLP